MCGNGAAEGAQLKSETVNGIEPSIARRRQRENAEASFSPGESNRPAARSFTALAHVVVQRVQRVPDTVPHIAVCTIFGAFVASLVLLLVLLYAGILLV
jgi:hypothetical protein